MTDIKQVFINVISWIIAHGLTFEIILKFDGLVEGGSMK